MSKTQEPKDACTRRRSWVGRWACEGAVGGLVEDLGADEEEMEEG